MARGRVRRLIAAAAARQVGDRIANLPHARLDELCEAVIKGEMDVETAAAESLTV